MKPNTLLKRERELRGWSQAKVAMELGVDPTTIGRWERGISLPYPYFREKLCALFGKSVHELALLAEESEEMVEQHPQTKFLQTFDPPSLTHYDHTIPQQPGSSTMFVGREALLVRLKGLLFANEHIPDIALNGLPGVGKTTLVVRLVHDKEVRAEFHDGILWAGLGPKPQIEGHLSRWATLLGVDTTTLHYSNNVLAEQIRAVIGMRRMLFVIDDAWTLEDVLALQVGGPNCVCVLTTRLPPLALASHEVITVPELDEESSLALLVRLASEVVINEAPMLQKLVLSVGGLPLALTLMGSYIRVEAYNKQPRRIQAALQRLRDEKERLYLSKPIGVLDQHPGLPFDTPLSLQSVIAISDQLLSEQARQALYALSVMPPKPRSFSEELALAVTALPAEALDELCDAGLLECLESNRYTLHQIIADYAHQYLQDNAPYQRYVTYFTCYIQTHERNYRTLGREFGHILNVLDIAAEQDMKIEYINSMNALAPILYTRGLYGLAEQHLLRAYQYTIFLNDLDNRIRLCLHLGEIAERRGNYVQAEKYFQEGLALAQCEQKDAYVPSLLAKLGVIAYQLGNNVQLEEYIQQVLRLQTQNDDVGQGSLLLTTLAAIALLRGDLAQVSKYLQEGLEHAKHTSNEREICLFLIYIGAMEEHQGNFAQAESILEQSMLLARNLELYEYIVALLTILGVVVEHRSAYTLSIQYFEEGLELAYNIKNPIRTGTLLVHLGRSAGKQGNYEQAKAYYKEALDLARQNSLLSLKLFALNSWGETCLHMGHLDAASIAFRQVLDLTPEGKHEFLAFSYKGLAQTAKLQQNLVDARTYGEASLRSFRAIGHYLAHEVQEWLDTL